MLILLQRLGEQRFVLINPLQVVTVEEHQPRGARVGLSDGRSVLLEEDFELIAAETDEALDGNPGQGQGDPP